MKKMVLYSGAVMLSLVLFFACNRSNESSKYFTAKANTPAKVFTVTNVKSMGANKAVNFSWAENGTTFNFADYTKGKVVFINFWGTWCPPCRAEIPDIIQINSEMSAKNLVVIGMASERVPETEAVAKVKEFAEQKGINYINFIANSEIKNLYGGISFVPTTFIIDKDGNIAEIINGMQKKEAFMEAIKKYVK